MNNKKFSSEFKEKVIKESQEAGNVALVARRHGIPPYSIHGWINSYKKSESVNKLPRAQEDREKNLEDQVRKVSKENDDLRRRIAEKEVNLAILKELTGNQDPQ